MASLRRHPRSGRWQVRYRDPDGRQHSKNFERKVDARRFANGVETDVARGEYVDPAIGRTTFGEYAKRWQATRGDLARSSQDRDESYLKSMVYPVFGDRAVGSIRPSEVGEWISNLDRAPTTRALALRIMSSILELARLDGAFKVNPAADVKTPSTSRRRVGKALKDSELSAVLDAAEEVDERTAGLVWLMARCGLRVGEAIALRTTSLDFDAGRITVSSSMSRRDGVQPPKTEAGIRTIPMPPDVSDRLKRHLAARRVADISGFVFTAPRGGPIRYDNWRSRTWSRILELVDIDDLHPHDLRHTAATRLCLVDRWSPAEVQRFLGHSDPRVTLAIYTHISTDDLREPSALPDALRHVDTSWTL
jgi:integrase